MAVDIYDSQYLLILAPTLVIALMFLFFWLFMKETSYDEVLARQKRDLKLSPIKPDSRKKNEKKKSKKKDPASGGSAGGGGESEEDLREFDLTDGLGSNLEVEEDPAPVVIPEAPAVSALVSASPEAPAGLRERKKKEKKAAKAAAAAAAAASAAATAAATGSLSEESEINGSKPIARKTESPPAVSKAPSTPPLLFEAAVPVQAFQVPVQAQTPPPSSGKKEKKKKQKAESVDTQQVEVRAEPAPVKKETPAATETKVLDGSAPSGKKKNSAKKQKTEPDETHILADLAASSNHQALHNDNVPSKGSSKKPKNETDKENREMKLKELLSGLSSLAMSDAEAVSVMALLREKSPNALDAWHKCAVRPDPAAQEREKLLTTLQEEASIAKEKVKQLSQELQLEKQKTGRVEAVMREQRAAMEKELGGMQAKAQGSYQELQTMQIKFQQAREQLESQITRLQQENGILRDAVSSATNQMESKNSAELNKLRSEYAGLMKELADNNGKLQQEEHQRKSLEVGYKQNVSQLEAQLQDAKRRWEELQNFLHTVNTEREKLQASKQELHSQLLAVETEMNNKNKEVQTLHGSLAEAMLSKDRLEQRVMELMEMSQHSMQDESLQAQVQELMNENKALQVQKETFQVQNESLQAQISSQASHVSHIEELQKLLAEKELQRKSLEDSLNAERSAGASRETSMQALHNDNMSLKAEVQDLQARIADQTASQLALDQFQMSVREKEESIKMVEGLLENGLIEVANKEEELKKVRAEREALRREIEDLKRTTAEKVSAGSTVEALQTKIHEKDLQLLSLEESLQKEKASSASRGKALETVERQLTALQVELEQLRTKEASTSATELQELQTQLAAKDQEIQMLKAELEARAKELMEKVEQAQQQSNSGVPSQELLASLSEKERQVSGLQSELAELRDSLELHRKKNNELREKNWSAMEALSATESMLQGKLSKVVKESQAALTASQAECRGVLTRLLPHVPLPTEQNHQEWLQRFEKAVGESSVAQSSQTTEDSENLTQKLKEAEESQKILQKDCETYKTVLGETEGILQRLQSSVEEEESRWKLKMELSQAELKEVRREKQHLECELERAERESATYVTEVRELKDLLTELQTRLDGSYTEAIRQNEELTLLKTQLTETLSKLEAEESERQKVAGDLYKAQQSLDLIQDELSKLSDKPDGVIENSSLPSETEDIDKKEKMTAGLNQTVREMQQLLQTVSQQLTKGQQGELEKDLPKV
ncbi:kinectin isoform X2 [Nothobranchius furzeri]|uniref:Kinectin 1 n=1 Tax=Nothobranchius furzeri TaxID=105023 RepID=A0A8C6VVY9_NOTFU|nr:transcript variant X3 [Nothobranchius furzeri]